MRTLSALALGALLAGQSHAGCHGDGCGPLGRLLIPHGAPLGYAPVEVIDTPFNYSWLTPHGGYVTYPGLPGSGFGSVTDYSQHSWVVPPEASANAVREKLRAMGIPLVPPETIFLGKNPRAADNLKLPIPRPKEKDKEDEKN